MSDAPFCAPPLPCSVPPKQPLPKDSVDCHFHIFDDPSPQVPEASYRAQRCSGADYDAVQQTLGFSHSVIVQPSIYGADNRTTMAACRDNPNRKAVIVVNQDISDQDLRDYADAGAVGCRVNMLFSSGVDSGDLQRFAQRLAEYDMHLQILANISNLPEYEALITNLAVPVIFDHMGHMPAHLGASHPAFQRFCRHLAEGRLWVKLSGAYRICDNHDSYYETAAEIVTALVSANPDNLVWGTDWPHPQINGPMVEDNLLLDKLMAWVPRQELRDKIFAHNAHHFYRF